MKSIYFNLHEVEKILEYMKLFESNNVEIHYENESGIGSVIRARYDITHKDIKGCFEVTITDQSDW